MITPSKNTRRPFGRSSSKDDGEKRVIKAFCIGIVRKRGRVVDCTGLENRCVTLLRIVI